MKPAEGSKRLSCEYAITRDCLWQIHWPDRYVPLFGAAAYDPVNEREDVPFEEQLKALEKVVKAGKVKLCQSHCDSLLDTKVPCCVNAVSEGAECVQLCGLGAIHWRLQ